MPHKVGDRPYVRESYWLNEATDTVAYGDTKPTDGQWKFVSAMFSLKRHSRLTIEITGVRVQQVRDISQADAAAEGMLPNWIDDLTGWDPDEHGYLPLNWRQLHGEDCEGCGVANHAVGARDKRGDWHDQADIDHMNSDVGYAMFGEYPKIIRIVCTTAHLNHNPGNNDLANLKLLCQRCHLAHDKEQHVAAAAVTRRRKYEKIQPALL